MRDKKLNIIVPCFNEEEALPETIRILLQELDGLASKNLIEKNSSRITFVDDGSKDETWKILSKEIKGHKNISGIKLSRNFGHQNALLAGMLETESDVLITIDADLQVPDTSKFKKHTGWQPEIPYEKTISDLLDYWRVQVEKKDGNYLTR